MREGGAIEVEGRPYRVGKRIGRGRTADVHLLTAAGDDSDDRSDLVVKLRVDRKGAVGGREISPTEFSDEIAVLQRLAQAAGPGRTAFVGVRAVGADGDWFVMDRAQGLPLHKVVGVTALTVEQIVSVCTQLGDALAVARRAGVRNTDLKLDAVFYDLKADHLVVIDWNVFAEWAPVPDAWIDPDAALVARVLDGLLRHKMVNEGGELPDWSRRFARAPARWAHYPRMFQGALTGLIEKAAQGDGDHEKGAQVELDDLRAPLARIAEALALPREALIDEVVQRLAESRLDPQGKVERIREALGLAQLVMQSTRWVTALRGRLAFQACIERLGRDAGSIAALWRAFDELDADVHVPPGEALELARLRSLVAMQRKAIGLSERLRGIAEDFAALRWRDAARALREVLREVDRPAQSEARLRMLFDEASGLARIERGLRRLDEMAPENGRETDVSLQALTTQTQMRAEALRDLEKGLEHLAQVEWGAALLRRLPEVETTRMALAEEVARQEIAIVSASRVSASGVSASGAGLSAAVEPPASSERRAGRDAAHDGSAPDDSAPDDSARDDITPDDSAPDVSSAPAAPIVIRPDPTEVGLGTESDVRAAPAEDSSPFSRATLVDYRAPWLNKAPSQGTATMAGVPSHAEVAHSGGPSSSDLELPVSLDPALPWSEHGVETEPDLEPSDGHSGRVAWRVLLGLVLLGGGGLALWVITRPPPEETVVRHTIGATPSGSDSVALRDASMPHDARMDSADSQMQPPPPADPDAGADARAAAPTTVDMKVESESEAARREREREERRKREEQRRRELAATAEVIRKQAERIAERERAAAEAAKQPSSGSTAGVKPGVGQTAGAPVAGKPSGTPGPIAPPAGATQAHTAAPTDAAAAAAAAEATRLADEARKRKAEQEQAARQKVLDDASKRPKAARPAVDDAFGKQPTPDTPR